MVPWPVMAAEVPVMPWKPPMNETSLGRPVASGTILPSVSQASEPEFPYQTFLSKSPGAIWLSASTSSSVSRASGKVSYSPHKNRFKSSRLRTPGAAQLWRTHLVKSKRPRKRPRPRRRPRER